jgi:hypothetical protein
MAGIPIFAQSPYLRNRQIGRKLARQIQDRAFGLRRGYFHGNPSA